MHRQHISYGALTLLLGFTSNGCGQSQDTLDAFDRSKSSPITTTTGGGPAAPGATTGGPMTPATPGAPGAEPDPTVTPGAPQFDCQAVNSQQFDPGSMQSYYVPPEIQAQVDSTMAAMSQAHKANQMMGVDGTARNYRDIERSPDVDVPGVGRVRGYRYRDAGRGVNLDAGQDNRTDTGDNFATVFPTPSLRAASFDVDLERRIGAAIGDETAASRNNMLLGPCMNIVRHPFWGRTQETYGEDMYHVGRMSSAFTVGIQEYVVACAKHWAANNIEKGRATQDAIMTEQTLREIYGRHFEMVVQDGAVGCIMASYNLINGVKATQNRHVLREVLKGPRSQGGFGYDGLVLTDWWAMPGDQNVPDPATALAVTIEAVNAGTDIEVPWTLHYTEATLAEAEQTFVDDAARRVLTQKFLFNSALDTQPWSKKPPTSVLLDNGSIETNLAHEDLAEEAVIKSAVLVNNGTGDTPLLPVAPAGTIAVIGPDDEFKQVSSSVPKSCGFTDGEEAGQGEMVDLRACVFQFATDPSLGDRGSSRVNGDPTRTIGPFRGFQEVAGANATVISGNSAAAAAEADMVVVVVGYTPGDEGEEYYIAEGGDRSTLDLPPGHNDMVMAALDLQKPTIIIIESGSIVNLPWLAHANQNQATIWASYPGVRGGTALAKLAFGMANFSGKMPMAWPAESELFAFKDTETATTMGYFFGYREFDRRQYMANTPVNMIYPFGHGLSYSTFQYSNVNLGICDGQAVSKNAIFNVNVDIANTSTVAGDEVAMLFVKPPQKPATVTGERPWKELKSFTRVTVPPGETVTAELPLRIQDLRRWEGGADDRWVIDSGEYTILVGKDAADAEAPANVVTVTVNGD